MFVDSHCHLNRLNLDHYQEEGRSVPYSQLLERCLEKAKAAGVERFLCVSIDFEDVDEVISLAQRLDSVLATVGVHPLYNPTQKTAATTDQSHSDLAITALSELTVEALLEKVRAANEDQHCVVGIGETGLDYHYCPEKPQWQYSRFETHLQAAVEVQMPVIIHSRAAKSETLDLLREYQISKVRGIMHCFTEDLDMAKKCIDMGLFISLSGILTFNNAGALREVAQALPLESLMIETDSPYLAPKPYRGRSNEPLYVIEVAKQLAELKGVSVERVAEQTTANFSEFINLTTPQADPA